MAEPYLPRTLRSLLRQAGFAVGRPEAISTVNVEFASYGHGVAGLIAAFVSGRSGVTQEDGDAWLADLRRLDEAGDYFFSLDQHLFVAVKPGE